MPGYTHYQAAVPTTYGHHLGGVAGAIDRDLEALAAASAGLDTSPLGAGVGHGTTQPIAPVRTAALLGFERPAPHSLDAVASRDVVLRLLAAAAVLGVTASRLAADLLLWTTAEFAFLELPDELVGSSSAMPQKRNPFLLEHVKGRSARAAGAFVAAATAMHASPVRQLGGRRHGGLRRGRRRPRGHRRQRRPAPPRRRRGEAPGGHDAGPGRSRPHDRHRPGGTPGDRSRRLVPGGPSPRRPGADRRRSRDGRSRDGRSRDGEVETGGSTPAGSTRATWPGPPDSGPGRARHRPSRTSATAGRPPSPKRPSGGDGGDAPTGRWTPPWPTWPVPLPSWPRRVRPGDGAGEDPPGGWGVPPRPRH